MNLGEFYSLACAVAWAMAIVAFRHAGQSLPAQHLNLLKNSVMLACLAPTLWLAGSPFLLPSNALWISLISGVIGIAIGDGLYLAAIQKLGASRAGLAGMMYSPWVVIFSAVWLGESLRPWQWFGMALVLIGLLGVGLTQTRRRGTSRESFSWAGLGLAAIAMALMAAGIVMVKPVLESEPLLTVVWWRAIAGTVPVLLWLGRPQAPKPLFSPATWAGVQHWKTLLFGCFIGAYVAMIIWLAGYKYAAASVAAILNESAALWIMLLAWWLLDERLNRAQLLSASLIASGVLLVIFT